MALDYVSDVVVYAPDVPLIYNVTPLGYVGIDYAPNTNTAPTVANITPSPGSPLSSTAEISLEVLDTEGFGRVRVFAEYASGDYDVVYDGSKFAYKYANGSYREVISGGYRFHIRPNTGWVAVPTLYVDATDSNGTENA